MVGMTAPEAVEAQATLGGDWRNDVAQMARRVVDAGLAPGVGIAVAIGDWVAWADGFGQADRDAGRAVTEDTPFYIASSTKSLTATAALIAAHKGDLDLDAPMTRYLPDAQLPDGVDRTGITVRDLAGLTHGLAGDGPVVIRTAYTGNFTREQLLALLRFHRATGRHGIFSYNNLGYNLLGLVLEAIYGESWKDVVHRLVLEPLGMRSTSAYRSRLDPDRLALPHGYGPEGFFTIPLAKDDANMHAAGGHFASARDLARYLAAHQSGGMLDGAQVLPREPLEATHRQHAPQDRRFGPYHRFGWGMGWDLGTYEGDTIIHRFGGFSGYRSHLSLMPAHRIGVVVLVNGDGPASAASDLLATHIYDRLLGRPDSEVRFTARLDSMVRSAEEARRGIARHLAERAARLTPLPHPLEAFAGTYESPLLGRMTWQVVAGGLEMRLGLVESRAEVFDAAANQLRIEVGGSGMVAGFEFPEGGGPARAVTVAGTRFDRVER